MEKGCPALARQTWGSSVMRGGERSPGRCVSTAPLSEEQRASAMVLFLAGQVLPTPSCPAEERLGLESAGWVGGRGLRGPGEVG